MNLQKKLPTECKEKVYIGKFLTEVACKEAIIKAFKYEEYIAQGVSNSMDFLVPDENNEQSPYKLVWGAFGFGDCYGGVWIRMSILKNITGEVLIKKMVKQKLSCMKYIQK